MKERRDINGSEIRIGDIVYYAAPSCELIKCKVVKFNANTITLKQWNKYSKKYDRSTRYCKSPGYSLLLYGPGILKRFRNDDSE